ncbi:MAG TPA: phosphatase PAP2 family protein [Acidisarcina sp.]|nr:phosphatase PAP2 family protein [Acidisarcina sp.]
MRTSEWIQGGFACAIAISAWLVPLSRQRRWTISLLALCALGGVGLSRASTFFLAPAPAAILRDWLPVVITLIPYWQTGQFFTGSNKKIEAWLAASDRWFLKLFSWTRWKFGRAARLSMEWAYFLCYPIVPLGLGALYLAGLRRYADVYWFLVLVPTYICYAITPFFPALPPRSLVEGSQTARTKSRRLNLWILKLGSIQAISFPSAHVASALGASLAVWHYFPMAGLIFLAISFWIAVAAVAGGYHYAIDVVLGAAVSAAVYLVWRAELIPSSLFTAPAITFVPLL